MKNINEYILEAKDPITPEMLALLDSKGKTVDIKSIKAFVNALLGTDKKDNVAKNNAENKEEFADGNEDVADSLQTNDEVLNEMLEEINEAKYTAEEFRNMFSSLLKAKKGGNPKAKIVYLIALYKSLQNLQDKFKPDAVRALLSGYDAWEKKNAKEAK